jgi:hypothetical protein
MVTLKPGDSVGIGKHTIVVSESRDLDGFAAGNGGAKPPAPKINETVMLDTKERREFLQKVAAVGESAQVAPARVKIATLVVRKGRTSRKEYALNDKLTVIGKSSLATVKLKAWFAPRAAAQITRREDGSYTIAAVDKTPSLNGLPITHPTVLSSGDVIAVAGIEIEFLYRD